MKNCSKSISVQLFLCSSKRIIALVKARWFAPSTQGLKFLCQDYVIVFPESSTTDSKLKSAIMLHDSHVSNHKHHLKLSIHGCV